MLPAEPTKTLATNVERLIGSLDPRPPRPELAARMGIGDKTLGFIKAGTGNPTLENISKVARFFRVEPWTLLKPITSQRERDSQPPVDSTLLSTCLTRAMALFREEQRLPTDHQIATVAGYLFSCAAHQRDLAMAEAEVRAMLGQFSQAPLQLREPADAR